uniref:(northern house mosquito) hypothetical protein n=1 Tax=Culex pipiens TaxID=7175 RepID=A0A8D8B255_CULPI
MVSHCIKLLICILRRSLARVAVLCEPLLFFWEFNLRSAAWSRGLTFGKGSARFRCIPVSYTFLKQLFFKHHHLISKFDAKLLLWVHKCVFFVQLFFSAISEWWSKHSHFFDNDDANQTECRSLKQQQQQKFQLYHVTRRSSVRRDTYFLSPSIFHFFCAPLSQSHTFTF